MVKIWENFEQKKHKRIYTIRNHSYKIKKQTKVLEVKIMVIFEERVVYSG